MGTSLIQRNKVVAKRKGTLAAVAVAASVATVVAGAPIIGVLGLVGAGVLGWDWLSFRIKNGMRF